MYLNSATSLSVVLSASEEVEGLGGSEARKSPYAGDSCSLTSGDYVSFCNKNVGAEKRSTIYRFTLGQITVILPSQQCISVSSNHAFDVARMVSRDIPRGIASAPEPHPPLTL